MCHAAVPCQQFIAQCKKHGSWLAPVSDESVVFWELSLDMHTLRFEKKLLLSLLSIKTSLGCEEGGSDQQMAS